MSGAPKSDESTQVTGLTISYYEGRAAPFWEGTKDHDVTQNYEALLGALPARKGLRILDFGCGPGRDVKWFADQGHEPVGLDGTAEFCEMARAHSGCEVLHQNFIALDLPPESFDGIFANASLFHVPRADLPRVLGELFAALRPGGVLFSSNPRGDGEGMNGPRYGNYMEFEAYAALLEAAGFEVVHHYYRPKDKPREEQPWLAVVAKKPGELS